MAHMMMFKDVCIKVNNYVISSYSAGGWPLLQMLIYYFGYGSDAKQQLKDLLFLRPDTAYVSYCV